jgi:PQQ-dependent dehydrogenase (methanol/ethanol family)
MTGSRLLIAAAVFLGAVTFAVNAQQTADWPSYNRTLTSERYAPLSQIDRASVARLKVLCTYDVGAPGNFQTGLIQVGDQLVGTTDTDIFSLDPNTCAQQWRTREELSRNEGLRVNRGAAYLDGRLFRGTPDGRVIAYDAKSGKRLWHTTIAIQGLPESVPSAPIAWNGMVFAGIAGGDSKGVKGRVYAFDAASGKILWEAYLVPRAASDPTLGPSVAQPSGIAATWGNEPGMPISGGGTWTSYSLDPAAGVLYVPAGNPAPDFVSHLRPGANLYANSVVALDARTGAFKTHYPMVQGDYHDWDVSSAPAIVTTRQGRRIVAGTPKDGYLYGFDLASAKQLYKTPVTTILNADAPLTTSGTRFCPGTLGGSEWNGPAFDATRNLLFTGQVEWCVTVALAPEEEIRRTPTGQAWSGGARENAFGKLDPPANWKGHLRATDADTGMVRWQFVVPNPVESGVTPTAGGIVLFGDAGGNLYALDSDSGKVLWSQKIGGAIGGGVITYTRPAGQRIAVAAGMSSRLWPTEKVNNTVVILGLP